MHSIKNELCAAFESQSGLACYHSDGYWLCVSALIFCILQSLVLLLGVRSFGASTAKYAFSGASAPAALGGYDSSALVATSSEKDAGSGGSSAYQGIGSSTL